METINWNVQGITCANCTLTIKKYLEKEGMKEIKVNMISGDLSFTTNGNRDTKKIREGIEELGYSILSSEPGAPSRPKLFRNHLQRFLFCLIFTLPLMLHMVDTWLPVHWLMNPWLQLSLCLPVYAVGMQYFGKSAVRSIRNEAPNMNVLIATGSSAAFIYSLIGTIFSLGPAYLFYETAAAIITLVFLGNFLEEASINSTQKTLNSLARSQKVMANMIAFDDQHRELIFPIENVSLRSGDLILIRSGEQVPADCKILWGNASVNESIITGESMPREKKARDLLLGGSLIEDGTVKAQVTAEAEASVLSNIIDLVKQAQAEKPPVQQLADRISAVFVPVVLALALLTFVINYIVLHDLTGSLMRMIAVLVIACPCAMGLATPAAIAVGLGRAARRGILFRNAKSLELFKNIRQVVFDKTGTLTTGSFRIAAFHISDKSMQEDEFKKIAFSLEKYSNHPLATAIVKEWKRRDDTRWIKTEEIKGSGMKAITASGDEYRAGSWKFAGAACADRQHNIYIQKNSILLGWIDMEDEIRSEAPAIISYLKKKNIHTILLSGDLHAKTAALAEKLGISQLLAEQSPAQKLQTMEQLVSTAPTAMVGDGINDAPALAKATIGISISEASQLAMQTADVVMVDHGLRNLPLALGLGKHTYITIRQNLFWAFFYNIVAIPVAALGLLTPVFGALVMALSDVVLAANSSRLFVKKVI